MPPDAAEETGGQGQGPRKSLKKRLPKKNGKKRQEGEGEEKVTNAPA